MATTKKPGVQLYEELSEQRPRLTKEWFKQPMEVEELETLMQVGDYIDDYFLMAMRYKAGIEFRRHKEEQKKGYKDWLTANLTVSEATERRLRMMADNVDAMVEEGHKHAEIFQLTLKELYKSKSLRPGEDPPLPKPRAIAEKPEEASETSEPEDDSSGSEESESSVEPVRDDDVDDLVDSLNEDSPVETIEEAAKRRAEEFGDPPEDKDEAKTWILENLEMELQVLTQVLLMVPAKARRRTLLQECLLEVAGMAGIQTKKSS